MRLKGKTALITGASRNIGKQIALTFAREGADLILNTRRSKKELDAVAAEMAPFNIRANMVNPGSINTERRNPEWYPEFGKISRESTAYLKSLPLGREGSVDDVANACLFLASDESSYITGDRLNVVGGRYIV